MPPQVHSTDETVKLLKPKWDEFLSRGKSSLVMSPILASPLHAWLGFSAIFIFMIDFNPLAERQEYKNLCAWSKRIGERPAVLLGRSLLSLLPRATLAALQSGSI